MFFNLLFTYDVRDRDVMTLLFLFSYAKPKQKTYCYKLNNKIVSKLPFNVDIDNSYNPLWLLDFFTILLRPLDRVAGRFHLIGKSVRPFASRRLFLFPAQQWFTINEGWPMKLADPKQNTQGPIVGYDEKPKETFSVVP